jgi:hypothetical protein
MRKHTRIQSPLRGSEIIGDCTQGSPTRLGPELWRCSAAGSKCVRLKGVEYSSILLPLKGRAKFNPPLRGDNAENL